MATGHKRSKKKNVALGARRLAADIEPLVRKLVRLREEAAALGTFTDERALLACPRCGLREDVAAEGRLFTAFGNRLGDDTGLRFAEMKTAHVFRCPFCGADVLEPEEMD